MHRRIGRAIFGPGCGLTCAAIGAILLGLAGCTSKAPPPPPKEPLWPTLPLQQVPNFMQGTLFERVRFSALEEMPVYGYSLAVNLHDTGNSNAPSMVRDYIIKQMLLRGFDSYVMGTYQNVSPEQMLRDKRVAIVEVEGRLPVGARAGQSFDVIVRALQHNSTKSLAHGDLYQCDMSDIGLIEPQGIDPDNVLVEVPTPENRENRHVQRKFLNQILEARSRELFQFVRAELARVGMDRALLGGVFLTGAGARLPELCDVAERVLQCQARYGLAVGIQDWPEEMRDPEWTTAAGLAMYSAKLKVKADEERESAGWLGRMWR